MLAKCEDAAGVARLQGMPLYHQIFLQLREEITSGERAFGSRLPTEDELAAQFGVSRITARRAVVELAENFLVERKRRVGTTVTFRSPARPFRGDIGQALESLRNFGRSTQVTLLEAGYVPARPPIDEALLLEPDAEMLRVVRVRWLDGQPVGYFVSFIPADIARRIVRARLESAPLLTLIEEAGVQIGAARQTITATLADVVLSPILQVDIGSPILRVSRTVEDRNGKPVQHILAQFRPDRYQIRLDLGSVRPGRLEGREAALEP